MSLAPKVLLALWWTVTICDPAYAVDTHKPGAWCGWYARLNLVPKDPGVDYNLAANWAHYGRASSVPCLNCMTVWSHHVGKITGPCKGYDCMVTSGNDDGAVRSRVRNVRGAAYRIIP